MTTEQSAEAGEPIDGELQGTGVAEDPIRLTTNEGDVDKRLDQYLVEHIEGFSRSLLQKAIEQKLVLVGNQPAKVSRRLKAGEAIQVILPEKQEQTIKAEPIPLDVVYEDDFLVVINKPAGLIVHPGRGNYSGTLANALQFHFDELSDQGGEHRPGIVHRLDRDTSGVLVVAKNNQIHAALSQQFEHRDVEKEYLAIVWGHVEFDSDFIETDIRVHSKVREKMTVCPPSADSRHASTFYETVRRTGEVSVMRLFPKTGRTHQLRVHMQHLGHPILADKMYGGRHSVSMNDLKLGLEMDADQADKKPLIKRQALHARRLKFRHPESEQWLEFEAPVPEDMQSILDLLEQAEPTED